MCSIALLETNYKEHVLKLKFRKIQGTSTQVLSIKEQNWYKWLILYLLLFQQFLAKLTSAKYSKGKEYKQ